MKSKQPARRQRVGWVGEKELPARPAQGWPGGSRSYSRGAAAKGSVQRVQRTPNSAGTYSSQARAKMATDASLYIYSNIYIYISSPHLLPPPIYLVLEQVGEVVCALRAVTHLMRSYPAMSPALCCGDSVGPDSCSFSLRPPAQGLNQLEEPKRSGRNPANARGVAC